MPRRSTGKDVLRLWSALAFFGTTPAHAHSFGQVYTLPVPFWLYAWAAAAALVASFVVAALFLRGQAGPAARTGAAVHWHALPRTLVAALRAGALFLLALCIASGLAGTRITYANFNMTAFWVVFVLGVAYLSAAAGDLYALINPWRTLAELIGRVAPAFPAGRVVYPRRFGYAPALVLYGAFVWLELLGKVDPFSLSVMLALYTALNLAAVAWIGARDWFRYGELFSVVFALLARLAPVAFEHESGGPPSPRFRWRAPLSGVLEAHDDHPTLVLLALFMLSATAFDGLHQAQPWVRWFWTDLWRDVWSHWLGGNIVAAFPALMKLYRAWQSGWLLVSPLLYAGAFGAAMLAMRGLAGADAGARTLAQRFFPSLLPIVLVYHASHYFTLLWTQGPKIVALASDPFGFGWNLLGTAHWFPGARVPDLTLVWHVQVGLILAGHIASVALAHEAALREFGDRRRAALSQLPMLALMVAFTVAGLWILSLPFEAPLAQPPV